MWKFLKNNTNPNVVDQNGEIDDSVLQFLKKLGLFGIQVPEKYKGLGLNATQFAKIIETFESYLSLAVTLGSHQSIGFKGLLLYGNDDQKNKYLSKVASGEMIASFALTEPNAGSDVSSIESKAILSDDKSHYILNGTKIWISNSDKASLFTVFAKTNIDGNEKINAFLVDRNFGGVSNGSNEIKMGLDGVHAVSVHFDNVKIPVENLLGEPGAGFKIAMNILNSGRFGTGALMCAVQRYLIKKALESTKDKIRYGQPLTSFQDIQHKLACMAADLYTSEAITYIVSNAMDNNKNIEVEAAICKIFSTEAAWKSVDECIQLFGGKGYMKNAGIERIMRDLRVFRIFEGTNDILRQFIILHPLKKCEINYTQTFKILFSLNLMNINKSKYISYNYELARTHKTFLFECLRNLVMYKKLLKDQQLVVRYLADTLIHLFGASAVLSRCASNKDVTDDEFKLFVVAFHRNIHKAKDNLLKISSQSESFSLVGDITKALLQSNGYFTKHPLE